MMIIREQLSKHARANLLRQPSACLAQMRHLGSCVISCLHIFRRTVDSHDTMLITRRLQLLAVDM
jgi:hypothetical protein